jgi:hypothetical protein
MGQKGFWDLERRQQKLNQKKDVLVTLNAMIPWESFRALLESIRQKPRRSNAGRKPFDVILLFKLMILQMPIAICSIPLTILLKLLKA